MRKQPHFVFVLLLIFALILSLSAPAFAAEDAASGTILWRDKDGNETCISWMEEDGILVIEKGDSTQVDGVSFNESGIAERITDAVIAEEVPFIGVGAFAGCSALESLIIPASVVDISPYAFAGCGNLKIFYPDAHHVYYTEKDCSVPDKNFLFTYTPAGEKELIAYPSAAGEVTVPSDIKVIGAYAFNGCKVEYICIPDGVTDIGNGAFDSCRLLSYVELPASIKTIGEDAFALCADGGILPVFYAGAQEDWDNIQIAPLNDCLRNAVIIGQDGAHIQVEHPEKIFTITLDANGGICALLALETDAQGAISRSALPFPTRMGYSFAGWYTEKEGGECLDGGAETFTVEKNTILYAHWTKDAEESGSPGEPKEPDKPDKSNQPDEPSAPDAPGESDEPITPDTPNAPNEPDTANKPEHFAPSTDTANTAGKASNSLASPIIPSTVPAHSAIAIYKPSTPPTRENLAKDHWEPVMADGGVTFRHLEKDGTPSNGSQYIETFDGAGLRYIFNSDGTPVTMSYTGLANACISVSPEGDVLANGHLYYLNPDRDKNDPRTCFVMTDYLRIRENYVGQTYYDQNGITFAGWMRDAEGGLRYQTRISQPDRTGDLYLVVWRAQTLPTSPHPDDPSRFIPAGQYFFDDAGILVQEEGWYDGKDGNEYYTNGEGRVLRVRAHRDSQKGK